jgi:hypothetical protein
MNLVSLWRNRAGQTLAVAFSAIMAIGFVLHGVSAFAADDGLRTAVHRHWSTKGSCRVTQTAKRIYCLTIGRILLIIPDIAPMKANRFRLLPTSQPWRASAA